MVDRLQVPKPVFFWHRFALYQRGPSAASHSIRCEDSFLQIVRTRPCSRDPLRHQPPHWQPWPNSTEDLQASRLDDNWTVSLTTCIRASLLVAVTLVIIGRVSRWDRQALKVTQYMPISVSKPANTVATLTQPGYFQPERRLHQTAAALEWAFAATLLLAAGLVVAYPPPPSLDIGALEWGPP